jgi:hypothetical protein
VIGEVFGVLTAGVVVALVVAVVFGLVLAVARLMVTARVPVDLFHVWHPVAGKPVCMPGAHDAFATELRAKPGQWAVWNTYTGEGLSNRAGPAAWSVRTGRVRSFMPTGSYEATARSAPPCTGENGSAPGLVRPSRLTMTDRTEPR